MRAAHVHTVTSVRSQLPQINTTHVAQLFHWETIVSNAEYKEKIK